VLDKRQFDRQAMGVGALGLPVPVPVPVPTRQWIDRFEARYMDSGAPLAQIADATMLNLRLLLPVAPTVFEDMRQMPSKAQRAFPLC
jgi:hypothetical protein